MTDPEIGQWALVGTSPAGQFLLERFRIRPDFPLVSVCILKPDETRALRTYSLPVTTEYDRLLDDPHISGVILTAARPSRSKLLLAALTADKRVVVEGELGLSVADSFRLVDESGDRLGMFQLRRSDDDFLTAKAAISSGRLGRIHTVRYVSCVQALPDSPSDVPAVAGWPDARQLDGPFPFDELQQLVPGSPVSVTAWSCPPTAGFMARLDYPHGASAWIDLQRASLCGLATGWVLEGDAGAYHNRRIMTRANDGEIIAEELLPIPLEDVDVMTDLKQLAVSRTARRSSLISAVQSAAMRDAIENAIQSGKRVEVQRRDGD